MAPPNPPDIPWMDPIPLEVTAWMEQEVLEPPHQPKVYRKLIGLGFEEDTATPENLEYRRVMWEEQLPLLTGPVNADQNDLGSQAQASKLVIEKALELGADLASVCKVLPEHVYQDKQEVVHKYGIVLALAMDYDALAAAPFQPAGEEVTRGYMELGAICIQLAVWLRERGWEASAHHPRGDRYGECDLLFIPHAIQAGLGELGKHGSLLTPAFGPRLRLGMVTTQLPLEERKPVELGFANFCVHCTRCTDTCPAGAISSQKAERRGSERFLVDTEACLPYFAKYDGCGICLNECVLNLPGPDLNLELARKISAKYGKMQWWQVTHPHHQKLVEAELKRAQQQ